MDGPVIEKEKIMKDLKIYLDSKGMGDEYAMVKSALNPRDYSKQRAVSTILGLLYNFVPNVAYYAVNWDQLIKVFYKDVKVKYHTLTVEGESFKVPIEARWSKERSPTDVVKKIIMLAGFTMASKVELVLAILGLASGSLGAAGVVLSGIAYRLVVLYYFYNVVIKPMDSDGLFYRDEKYRTAHKMLLGTPGYNIAHKSLVKASLKVLSTLIMGVARFLPDEVEAGYYMARQAPGAVMNVMKSKPKTRVADCVCKTNCDPWYSDNTCYIPDASKKRCRDLGAIVTDSWWGPWTYCKRKSDGSGHPIIRDYRSGSKKKRRKVMREISRHRRLHGSRSRSRVRRMRKGRRRR